MFTSRDVGTRTPCVSLPLLLWALLLVPLVFDALLPTAWWKTHSRSILKLVDSTLLPGWQTFMLLVLAVPPIFVSAVVGGSSEMQYLAIPLALRKISDLTTDKKALSMLFVIHLAWVIARAHRGKDWKVTFGLLAMINMQFLLVPVCRSSPLLSFLQQSPENAVRFHRFLGWTTALFMLGHAASFSISWAINRELSEELLSWKGHIPIFPGVLAFGCATIICITSYHKIRRKWYEFFLLTHRAFSLIFLVFTVLHFPGIIWWILPGVLLFVADYFTQLVVCRGCTRVHDAHCAHDVLTLKLGYASDMCSPQPTQWVMLQAPAISTIEWHPFTIASIVDDGFVVAMKVVLGGWTEKFCQCVVNRQDISLQMAGFYGQGYRHFCELSAPVCMIAGGSGVAPFLAVLQAYAQRCQAVCKGDTCDSSPPLLLVWCCRRRLELEEYMIQFRMQELVQSCPKLVMYLFITGGTDDSCSLSTRIQHVVADTSNLIDDCVKKDGHTTMKRKMLVTLCHIAVSSGGILGLAVGFQHNLNAAVQVLLLFVGTCLGGFLSLLLASVPWTLMLHKAPLTKSSYYRQKDELCEVVGIQGQSTLHHDAQRRVSSIDGAPAIADMDKDHISVGRSTQNTILWHRGRPDLAAILSSFHKQCESLDSLRSPLVIASGPFGLMSAAAAAASSCGLNLASLSFEL